MSIPTLEQTVANPGPDKVARMKKYKTSGTLRPYKTNQLSNMPNIPAGMDRTTRITKNQPGNYTR